MGTARNLFRKCSLVKEIVSRDNELHFRRWRIFQTRWCALYIHEIFRADEDDHCHSHPWNFTTLILYGGYVEQDDKGNCWIRHPGSKITHKATDFHKIIDLIHGKVVSLVFVWGRRRQWGYSVEGKWVDHISYRQMKRDGCLPM